MSVQPGCHRRARRLSVAFLLLLGFAGQALAAERVVVGSKNFPENRLLGEMAAQLIEVRTSVVVERRLGLAGTQVCFEALVNGAIDLYPEYTGTGLVSILDEPPLEDRAAALARVRSVFLDRWRLHWLVPLGFENAYEVAVPRGVAERHGLESLSDLARVRPLLRAGFGFEFIERPDGLPGLVESYGLEFSDVRPMQQALKYSAAGAGDLDVLDVYTTDGRLLVHDLQVLDDDLDSFPPYEAVLLTRQEALSAVPDLAPTLSLLSNALDEETMRSLNLRLQENGESEKAVARDALIQLRLLEGTSLSAETPGKPRSIDWSDLGRQTREHLVLTGLALAAGVLVAVPIGLWLERRRRWAEGVIRLLGATQTIPSIALLAFMIPLLGVGFVPALVALWIYALFPIVRNTYTGLVEADPEAAEAGLALGMTPREVLLEIRLPLAVPVLLAGVRTAAVLTVGTATLAAFIGAGGLGEPIVSGLQLADTQRILSGALPAALLALVVDGALGAVQTFLTPRR